MRSEGTDGHCSYMYTYFAHNSNIRISIIRKAGRALVQGVHVMVVQTVLRLLYIYEYLIASLSSFVLVLLCFYVLDGWC